MSELVAVIAGGLSAERDVSIRSGRRIAEELRKADFEVAIFDLDSTLVDELIRTKPACVFPLVHGPEGEAGSLQEVLAALGLPFVGSTANGCRRGFDKSVASGLLEDAGFSIPDHVVMPQGVFRELGAQRLLEVVANQIGLPAMVKPNRGGSALGATKVETTEELPPAMVAAFAYSDEVIIEQFIEGTEVAVSVIDTGDGPVALPAVEIVPDSGIYDFSARYTAGTTEFFVPARLSDDALAKACELAVAAHTTLGARDWSRTDLIVNSDGVPHFIEINVVPGVTETSLFPQSVQASSFEFPELLATLVNNAIARG